VSTKAARRAPIHVLTLGLVAAPPLVVAAWLGQRGEAPLSWPEILGLLGVAVAASLLLAWRIEGRQEQRLRTVASVLAAYRDGDFSVRARSGEQGTPLGEVLAELNQLGDVLRAHRHGEMEAWALLRKVMAEVDVVVLAIDEEKRIRLANDAAARFLGRPSRDLVGASAEELGLSELLSGNVPRILEAGTKVGQELFDPSAGRWELRRGTFRLSGEPQTLLVLSDVSRTLRDNEREAWRRLVRVIGHEINNSLSPIKSISESLVSMLDPSRSRAGTEWVEDVRDGLGVISRRAEALVRFMTSYATLARLPPPRRAPVDLASIVTKIVGLEKRAPVELLGGPDVVVDADADQLEQALINLVKNAAEATLEVSQRAPADGRSVRGSVRVQWSQEDRWVTVAIEDDGPGVDATANLFVPFFTTKPNGSGIGLALSRQIVEAHDGQLSLASRPGGGGAVARVRLPLLV
jgi:nitrogen fixation/metabolism regulation signal transduction histidine kinase